jgi:hypothetical protein
VDSPDIVKLIPCHIKIVNWLGQLLIDFWFPFLNILKYALQGVFILFELLQRVTQAVLDLCGSLQKGVILS